MIAESFPPENNAERSILGAALLGGDFEEIRRALDIAAFALDSHRRIYSHMCKLSDAGKKIDIVTLTDSLAGETSNVGGRAYLASLTEGLPRRLNVSDYIRLLGDRHMRRLVKSVCQKYAGQADDNEASPADLIASADRELLAIAASGTDDWPSVEIQTHAELQRMHAQRKGEEIQAYSYGIASLDQMIGGLVPRELTVLGGRPAQGKSSLIAQVVARHCANGVPVHVFSIEMPAGMFLRRLWALVAGVPFSRVRHPERQTDEENRLVNFAAQKVSTWPLQIDDVATISPGQLVSRARMLRRRMATKIVCVDYLQKLRFAEKSANRWIEVTAATVALAALAKEEELAVLLLSSVSEKAASHRNEPPTLQDFRQSGDIAYEASTALLIHREIDEETEKPKLDGQIIVAKARSDETGAVNIRFNSSSLIFEDPKVVPMSRGGAR
jgi:replicative DNA helicase